MPYSGKVRWKRRYRQLSEKVKPAAAKPKLTRGEKREISAVIRKYKGDGKPHTAQESIPYETMYQDGTCHIGGKSYSKSIEFFDVNYQLAKPDDQAAIFEYLCDMYNYLDASVHVQLTFVNRKTDREQISRSLEIPPCGDDLDPIRQENTDILKSAFLWDAILLCIAYYLLIF